jgi:hypothetical protein
MQASSTGRSQPFKNKQMSTKNLPHPEPKMKGTEKELPTSALAIPKHGLNQSISSSRDSKST